MERKNTETFAASVDVFRQSVNAQAEKLGFKPVPAQAMAGPADAAANPANAPMAPQTIAQSAMNYGQAVLTGNANPITDAASFGGTLTNTLGKMFGGMIPAAPLNAPQAQQITPATAGQQANSQPIQVQTQGQQEITVRLPDIQALVNQSITAMIFETVGTTFNTIAEGVRTANNFEDAANAISQAATQTTTQNMGGKE